MITNEKIMLNFNKSNGIRTVKWKLKPTFHSLWKLKNSIFCISSISFASDEMKNFPRLNACFSQYCLASLKFLPLLSCKTNYVVGLNLVHKEKIQNRSSPSQLSFAIIYENTQVCGVFNLFI